MLVKDAIDTVSKEGRASASLLQRKLSIGYSRAARILDKLEEMGIVGPQNGSKPRAIISNFYNQSRGIIVPESL